MEHRVWEPFRKTELCRFFAQGCCLREHGCDFAHGVEELRIMPNLAKTSMCKDWCRNACPLSSEQCQFAHGKEELRTCREKLRRTQASQSKWTKEQGLDPLSETSRETAFRAQLCQRLPKQFWRNEEQLRSSFFNKEQFQESEDCQPDESKSQISTAVSGLSDSKGSCNRSVLEDDWLSVDAMPETGMSRVMFEALPGFAQAALLSLGSAHLAQEAYLNADMRTEAWTRFIMSIDTDDLYRKLCASMPDHYED